MNSSILGIGVTALNVAQAGLAAASHNISNAATPGYSRQSIVQTTAQPQYTGAGYFGQGANVETVRRSYNGFLVTQLREVGTQAAHLDTLRDNLSNIDNLLSDPATGLTPALNEFFASVNVLANHPGDTPSRQQLLSSAQVLAGRYRGLADSLASLREQANDGVSVAVSEINSKAASIADLNDRIRAMQSPGNAPNDLLDQRELQLRDLGAQMRINVVAVADGTLNVFMSNGQGLVMGTQSFAIAAQADAANALNMTVGINTGAGFRALRESDLSGGVLGGLLAFRNGVLDGAENALGRSAAALAAGFNAQHMAGQDRNGALGAAFFSTGVGPQVLANTGNTGTAQLGASISNANALKASDYRVQYDGANYTVTRLSDSNAQVFASLPQTVDGLGVSLAAGAPAAGDSFIVQAVRGAARNLTTLLTDTAAVAAALPMRGAAAVANVSTATFAVSAVTPPPGVNLTQPVTITFTAPGIFSVAGTGTGNPAGLAFTAGMTLGFNGWSASFDGTPAAGDVFTVIPNSGGSGDNGNLLALARLGQAKLLDGGTASVQDVYAQMVTGIGVAAHGAIAEARAQTAVAVQAEAAQQAVSGVNLDEEAAALLKYQQAYQAAAKVIATANTLFNEILLIMR